tara:strand:- start:670 stop:891 length:222 start_codon:yes stop_codon:yes gene_type:complete
MNNNKDNKDFNLNKDITWYELFIFTIRVNVISLFLYVIFILCLWIIMAVGVLASGKKSNDEPTYYSNDAQVIV